MKSALVVCLLFVLACGAGLAQSPSSNKAFFAANTADITLAPFGGADSSEVTLFDIPAALKTSNNGAVTATLSMECALWTYNVVEAFNTSGKNSSSSRAMIKAWVEIDGNKATPEDVVYCDRLQAVGLVVNLDCTAGDTTCDVTGSITLDMFQATKNANAFTFFTGPLGSTTHSVVVKAQGAVECKNNSGGLIPCPSGVLAGIEDAGTKAVIGKATLVVEEQQNWGAQ
jgi:hypothetical protein